MPNLVRKRIDWEAAERDFRAGMLSNREIGTMYGVSEGMVRKKAKEMGWLRDLTQQIQEKARAEIARAAAPQTEKEVIATAAAAVVQVVRLHRTRIGIANEGIDILFKQLIESATNRDLIEQDIEDETEGEKNPERRNRMLRAVSLPSHAAVMLSLSNALKNLVGMERQAFNIDTKSDASNPYEDQLKALGL